MKTIRTQSGPFNERQLFSQSEIELICESELEKADLLPLKPEPIRIERLVEKRFGITVQYEPIPDGILGYTRFGPKGVDGITISRELEDAGTNESRRRVNTTLAHEAGHGFLHSYLFALANQKDIFSVLNEGGTGARVLCRDGATSWWETQANMVMGTILLPEFLVRQCVEPLVVEKSLPASAWEAAVRSVSETFDVNPIVAKIRLRVLFP